MLYLPMREPHPLRFRFLEIFARLGIEVIDLSVHFPEPQQLFVQNGGHYSISGNAEVGRLVFNEFERLLRTHAK